MSEINDNKELSEGNFYINLKLTNQYKWKYPIIKAEYKMGTYKKGSFCGGSNLKC